jgi:hypothetical protein
MGAGRPTDYKPEFCDEVIAAGQEGLSLTAFAGMIGVCRATINNWMAAHPEFLEAVNRHQPARTLCLERTLLSAEQGPKVTARIFALKNADPENWKDKHEHDVGGSLTVQIMRFSE